MRDLVLENLRLARRGVVPVGIGPDRRHALRTQPSRAPVGIRCDRSVSRLCSNQQRSIRERRLECCAGQDDGLLGRREPGHRRSSRQEQVRLRLRKP